MGSGSWSRASYTNTARANADAGRSDFGYHDHVLASTPRSAWTAHADLDPNGVALRESRDSDEHPTSVAIAVLFDVTGSMGAVPRELQKKLPELFGLLLRKGYVEHPQVLFGAIGDATCDRIPFQVGQFESDNRLDENLTQIALEGGGGGQQTESYELAMYFMARHTALDCVEKRGHKGYLFIVGDEMAYPQVKPSEVRKVIGDEMAESISTQAILVELQQKYEVFYIHPMGTSYWGDPSQESYWRNLLGQGYIKVEDLSAVCETIALTIGLAEGTVDDLDEGLTDLAEIGSTAGESVGKALATMGASKGAISTSDAPDGLDGSDGAERL